MKSIVQIGMIFCLIILIVSTPSGNVVADDGGGSRCMSSTRGVVSAAKVADSAPEPTRQLPVLIADGTGPVCMPGTGCAVGRANWR